MAVFRIVTVFATASAGAFNPASGLNNQSASGYWWTSSLLSAANAQFTVVASTVVSPGSVNLFKYYGLAVRCVFP